MKVDMLLSDVAATKLRAFAGLALTDIVQIAPGLTKTNPTMYIVADDTIRTRYSRCVADTMRGSTVVNAKRYNTATQVRTLQLSIHAHMLFFKQVEEKGGRLQVKPYMSPTWLPRNQVFG